MPFIFALNQNYPNPFNPTTTLSFVLAEPSTVSLKIYDLLGQQVASVFDRQMMDEGEQEVEFSADALASGVYFYRIVTEGISSPDDGADLPAGQKSSHTFIDVKKMLLIR